MLSIYAGVRKVNYRIYLDYSSTAYEEMDIEYLTANADYLYAITEDANVFIGAAVGAGRVTWTDTINTEVEDTAVAIDTKGDSGSGMAYGLKLGGIYQLGMAELEAGYRIYDTSIETESDFAVGILSLEYRQKVTSTAGFYVGLNYVF